MVGATVGVLVGAPIGVQVAGDRNDGTGRVWGTILGEVGGLVVSSTLLYAVTELRLRRAVLPVSVLVFGVLMAGPIVGYQLSSDAHAATETAFMIPLAGSF
ncbi:MAG: hypothetical protein H0T79_02595 [Deltaproteobacteria bacterium]|nr:hypothetical protein [Deltaproteobacteria bacterium]